MLDILAADIARALKGNLRRAELRRATRFASDGAGNQTPLEFKHYVCEGVIATLDEQRPDGAGRPNEIAVIELLAASLAGVTPLFDDRLQIDGMWFRIVGVSRDPAGALWTLRAVLDDPP